MDEAPSFERQLRARSLSDGFARRWLQGADMGNLRHDARVCRERERSEQTRIALGIEYPEERAARLAREAKKAKERRKEAQKGTALGLEVEE
jgi:hypothetical protein